MKKSIFAIIAVAFVLICSSSAIAVPVNISGYVTADNFLWVWDNASSWTALDTAESPGWRTGELVTESGNYGQANYLYFAVQNLVNTQYPEGGANPAAFLGSLTTPAGYFAETGTNVLLSDTVHWDIYSDLSWVTSNGPGIDPTAIAGWGTPTSYGTTNVWGHISGIDPNAEWIWTANNARVGMDNYAILRTQYTVAPVPEPATMSLLGMGVLGLLGLKRRKA